MLLTESEALEWRKELEGDLVFTNGVFELLHAGHIKYLHEAASLGRHLMVGVNSDASARRLDKGTGRPHITECDRAAIIAELRSVDAVIIFDEDTPERIIGMLRPEVIVKGGDYNPDSMPGSDTVRSYGGKVVTVSYDSRYSTTEVLRRIRGQS